MTSTAGVPLQEQTARHPSVLSVRNLSTSFPDGRGGRITAVNNVSLEVAPNSIVGIVGESGSGKSVLLRSILGLIEAPGRIDSGYVGFDGTNLITSPEKDLERMRGSGISTVFQNPAGSLNPIIPVRKQFLEAIRFHRAVDSKVAENEIRSLLADVGFQSPDDILDSRPFELSSGVNQRVLIAMALIHRPKIVLADEPTTSLDITVEAQIIDTLHRIRADYQTTIVIVSHDMGVISQISDRIVVMYAGRIVEIGETRDILTRPAHPYTKALIESVPSPNVRKGFRLPTISGSPPDLSKLGKGCSFASRCLYATDICLDQTPFLEDGPTTSRACHHPLNEDAVKE